MAKHIKVLKHFNCYNPGEVACFDDETAAQIVDRKFGVEVKVDAKTGAVSDDQAAQK
jgi:hypothetical protein